MNVARKVVLIPTVTDIDPYDGSNSADDKTRLAGRYGSSFKRRNKVRWANLSHRRLDFQGYWTLLRFARGTSTKSQTALRQNPWKLRACESILRTVGITCCLLGASTASLAEESQKSAETIATIDTSIPFAPGAREHFINVRGRFDPPSFQQGFVDGMHFRIDPDGRALFSRDPRLRNNVFEVECEDGIAGCVAIRGVVRLFLDAEGLLIFGLDADAAFDAIYVGYGLFDADQSEDNWKKLNASLDTVSVELLAGYDQMAVVKDGKLVQQIPLEGILVVGAYLKWVGDGQPLKVLPTSWEDSHEEESNPARKANASMVIGDGTGFQNDFKNDWATYSPLLQFEDESLENSHASIFRFSDQELGLGTSARVQLNDVVHADLNNLKQNDQIVFGIEQVALDPAINLGKLSSGEFAKLQIQIDASLQPDTKSIEAKNVSENDVAGLSPYVNKINVVSGEIKSDFDQEIISILMAFISEPFGQSQSKEVIVEPLASIIKPKQLEFLETDGKEDKTDIEENICKPAILATVEENVIIKKAMHNNASQSEPGLPVKFSDPSEALKGLPGIYVFTDYLAEPVHLKGKFNGAIHDEIEARLMAGGIKVITKEELPSIPGQPRMEVYFSKANTETGCSFAVWISVRQTMLLGRDKKILLLSGTWGSGGAHLRQYSDAPEFNTIMNHVDRFVADYKTANSKPDS